MTEDEIENICDELKDSLTNYFGNQFDRDAYAKVSDFIKNIGYMVDESDHPEQ